MYKHLFLLLWAFLDYCQVLIDAPHCWICKISDLQINDMLLLYFLFTGHLRHDYHEWKVSAFSTVEKKCWHLSILVFIPVIQTEVCFKVIYIYIVYNYIYSCIIYTYFIYNIKYKSNKIYLISNTKLQLSSCKIQVGWNSPELTQILAEMIMYPHLFSTNSIIMWQFCHYKAIYKGIQWLQEYLRTSSSTSF